MKHLNVANITAEDSVDGGRDVRPHQELLTSAGSRRDLQR